MKLYAEIILKDILSSMGLCVENIIFNTSEDELNTYIENGVSSEALVFLSILSGEYNNDLKQRVMQRYGTKSDNLSQVVKGTINFLVKILLIGTNLGYLDSLEDLIAKKTNRFFSVGGFKESILKVIRTNYETKKQKTGIVNIVDIELSLLLPVYTLKECKVILKEELSIKEKNELSFLLS